MTAPSTGENSRHLKTKHTEDLQEIADIVIWQFKPRKVPCRHLYFLQRKSGNFLFIGKLDCNKNKEIRGENFLFSTSAILQVKVRALRPF